MSNIRKLNLFSSLKHFLYQNQVFSLPTSETRRRTHHFVNTSVAIIMDNALIKHQKKNLPTTFYFINYWSTRNIQAFYN